jgi:hypothetical protein
MSGTIPVRKLGACLPHSATPNAAETSFNANDAVVLSAARRLEAPITLWLQSDWRCAGYLVLTSRPERFQSERVFDIVRSLVTPAVQPRQDFVGLWKEITMHASKLVVLGLLPFFLAPALAQETQPRDLSVEQSSVAAAGTARPGSLKVSVTADRADATYAIGETARLRINTNEDAYVTVFDIGPTGQVHQLFPNAYQTDNHVLGSRPVEIAGGNTGARIQISGPVGAELIKVVASNRPLVVIAENLLQGRDIFRSVEGGAQALVRNLDVVANDPNAGERKIAIENFTLRTIANRADNGPAIVIIGGQTAQNATAQNPAGQNPTTFPVVTPQATGLISVPAQQPFPLLLAVDKRAYKLGERVTLAVTSLQACYLTVLDVMSSGNIRLLFPNQITQNNAVAANQTVLVAGGSSPVSLQVAGPAGTEQLVAVCSTDNTPILTHKVDLAQLFSPAGERSDVTRDLSVVANRPAGTTSFATTAFRIQP